jgi:hypothetical protein
MGAVLVEINKLLVDTYSRKEDTANTQDAVACRAATVTFYTIVYHLVVASKRSFTAPETRRPTARVHETTTD